MLSDDEAQLANGAADVHEHQREARRLALGAVFEADFGQRTAARVLERRIERRGR